LRDQKYHVLSKLSAPEGRIEMNQTLMTQIRDWGNLLEAWERVEDNDGCAGIDGVTIDRFALELGENLQSIQRELEEESYKPDPLLRFYVDKDSGGKRALSIPTVRDRVAQTAVALVLGPILEREFEDVSFAYRKGRSRHNAISEISQWRDKGYVWVVDADIDSYFDEVEHDILIRRLREIVAEGYVIQLISQWIAAPIYEKDKITVPTKGLPQGNVISPLLANLYLDRFDEAMIKNGYKLIRYSDDFLILCKTKPKAEEALKLTRNLLSELDLELDPGKTSIVNFDHGFKYLGAIFARSLVTIPSPEGEGTKPPVDGIREARRLYSGVEGSALGQKLMEALQESESDFRSLTLSPDVQEPPAVEPEIGKPSPAFMRTLYIQNQGSVLRRQNERFVISKDDEIISEIPIMKVHQIVVFGNCMVTTPAMTTCLREGIPITFLSSQGRYYGRLESTSNTNVMLQQVQFARAADEDFCLRISKGFVAGKIQNMKVLLQRRSRNIKLDEIKQAVDALKSYSDQASHAEYLDQLRGYEGVAAARYFDVFDLLLKHEFGFEKRIRRPPTDPVNSLLSFGYTLLHYNIYSLLTVHNLNPYCGFFHSLGRGHPALASDLIEEFRAPVVDSLVIYLINSAILKAEDFTRPKVPGRPCLLSDAARRKFIKHFERKMHTRITHPHTGFHTDYRRCIELQVKELVRCVQDDAAEYRPMVMQY
jgi:CRISPR-associated protein Cas1